MSAFMFVDLQIITVLVCRTITMKSCCSRPNKLSFIIYWVSWEYALSYWLTYVKYCIIVYKYNYSVTVWLASAFRKYTMLFNRVNKLILLAYKVKVDKEAVVCFFWSWCLMRRARTATMVWSVLSPLSPNSWSLHLLISSPVSLISGQLLSQNIATTSECVAS